MSKLHVHVLFFLLGLALPAGRAEAATYQCGSCAACSAALASSVPGDIIELTENIVNEEGTPCIQLTNSSGVVFDGMGFEISRGSSGNYGIHSSSPSSVGNIIRNVVIRGFSIGIYVVGGGGNTFENATLIGNNTGIDLYSSSGNTIDRMHIRQNFTGIRLTYNSDNNVIRRSFIDRNHDSGLTFFPRLSAGDPENNQVFNNVFSNTASGNVTIATISSETQRDLSNIPFIFNASLACGQEVNLLGCGCMAGNYWALPLQQGFSQTCADDDGNGVCDSAYTIAHPTAVMVDAYPLSIPAAGCCADPDRDGDGYLAATCDGNDHDDDPLTCGAACHPGAAEVCDGFDNDGDGRVDATVACEDRFTYQQAQLPAVVAEQSCVEVDVLHKIYCFGGRTYGAPGYLDSIVSYDPADDQVTELQTRLPTGRSELACEFDPVTSRIYCFGGYWQETVCTQWNEYGGCIAAITYVHRLNEILAFNPVDESIAVLSVQLPTVLSGMGSAYSSRTSTIFIFGGTSSIHAGNRNAILEFDPVSESLISRTAVLPSPRFDHDCSADSATGRIYCFGGYGENGTLAEIVEYDPAGDGLVLMNASFADPLQNTSCVEDSIDHLIYCIGGKVSTSTYLKSVAVFDPGTGQLNNMQAQLIQGRFGHKCVEHLASSTIYCFGGSRNVVNLSEIVEYIPDLPIVGDVDDDGAVGLTDAISTLQVLAGFQPPEMLAKADIGSDRRLGLEEVVYQLGAIARN